MTNILTRNNFSYFESLSHTWQLLSSLVTSTYAFSRFIEASRNSRVQLQPLAFDDKISPRVRFEKFRNLHSQLKSVIELEEPDTREGASSTTLEIL